MTTHIVVVMDRSGSMLDKDLYIEAAGATNQFVEEIKDIKGRKSITIHQFDDKFETTCDQVTQSKVPELIPGSPYDHNSSSKANYIPRGMTALYDAVGRSIVNLGKKKNVLMCIVTDGEENASKEYTYDAIKKMIADKTEAGWKFDFLSSDLKAMRMGMDLGFNKDMKLNKDGVTEDFYFSADARGYANTTSMRTASAAAYMADVKDRGKAKKVVTK